MFQSSFSCESSLKFFSAEFSVELFNLVEFEESTFVWFYFYFLGSSIQEASDETFLVA